MIFVDENKRRVNIDLSNKEVTNIMGLTLIYKLDDEVLLKILNSSFNKKNNMVFNIVRDLGIQSFVEIYDIFYSRGAVNAYTMKNYQTDNTGFLSYGMENFLSVYKKAYNDFSILGNNHVMSVKLDNNDILFSEGQMIITTPENLITYSLSQEAIVNKNLTTLKWYLLYKIIEGYRGSFPITQFQMIKIRKELNALFCEDIKNYGAVEEAFKNYDTSSDYVRKILKR